MSCSHCFEAPILDEQTSGTPAPTNFLCLPQELPADATRGSVNFLEPALPSRANGDRPFNSKQDATAGRAGQKGTGGARRILMDIATGLPCRDPGWARRRGGREWTATAEPALWLITAVGNLKRPVPTFTPVLHCPRAPQH